MRNNGLLPSLLLALTLALGAGTAWAVLGLWGWMLIEQALGADAGPAYLQVLADGTPVLVHPNAPDGLIYHDLEGKPLPPGPEGQQHFQPSTLPAGPTPPVPGTAPWSDRVRAFSDGKAPTGYWYFVSEGRIGGSAYFVGYDSQSKTRLGYFGLGGFRTGPLPAEERIAFEGKMEGVGAQVFSLQHNGAGHPRGNVGDPPPGFQLPSNRELYILGADARLYRADLTARTVKSLDHLPPVRSVSLLTGFLEPFPGPARHLVARTDDSVLVLGQHGKLLRRYPLPDAVCDQAVGFAETSSREGLIYTRGPKDSLARHVDYHLYWASPEGRFRETTTRVSNYSGDASSVHAYGFVLPSPMAVAVFGPVSRVLELMDQGLAASPTAGLGQALWEYRFSLLMVQGMASFLAILCYRWQVLHGASRRERIVWTVFVLTLGLPGWIGYRFGHSWPALETCPGCNLRGPGDRTECVHCETSYPSPARVGTEVFA